MIQPPDLISLYNMKRNEAVFLILEEQEFCSLSRDALASKQLNIAMVATNSYFAFIYHNDLEAQKKSLCRFNFLIVQKYPHTDWGRESKLNKRFSSSLIPKKQIAR